MQYFAQDDSNKNLDKIKEATRIILAFEMFNNWISREINIAVGNDQIAANYDKHLAAIENIVNSYKDPWIAENIADQLTQLHMLSPIVGVNLDRYWKATINEIIRKISPMIDRHIEYIGKAKKGPDPAAIKALEVLIAKLNFVLKQAKEQPGNTIYAWENFMNAINGNKSLFLKTKFNNLNTKILPLMGMLKNEPSNTNIQKEIIRLINPQVFLFRSYIEKLKVNLKKESFDSRLLRYTAFVNSYIKKF